MTHHTDFEDDYPEAISAFDPRPEPLTAREQKIVAGLSLALGGAIVAAIYFGVPAIVELIKARLS